MKWLIRPKRFDDESKSGYFFRLAEANGFYSLKGWHTANSYEGMPCSPETAATGARDANRDQRFTLVTYLRVCPSCMKENPYIRAAWDHALLPSCLAHQVELVDSCPACGSLLRRGPGRVQCCPCGYAYTRISPEAVVPTSLEYVLAQKIGFPAPASSGPQLAHLSPLSAADLIKLTMLIGTYEPGGSRRKPRKVSLKCGSANSKKIVFQASEALSDWPLNFHRLLSQAYSFHGKNSTLQHVFGSFYTSIYKDLNGEQFQFIRHAFEAWLAKEWHGYLTERHRRLAKGTRSKRKVVPVTALSKDLGVSASQLEELVATGQLRGSTRVLSSGRKTTMIELRQEREIMQLTSRHNLVGASRMLGLPESRLRALLEAGVMKGVPPVQGGKWRIHISELERLLAAMKAIKLCQSADREGYWTLDQILRFRMAEGDSFPDLFQAIIDGRLECCRMAHIGKLGAAGILVDRKSLRDWQLNRAPGLSIPQVAELLRVKQEVAYHLVRINLIQTTNRGRLGDFVGEGDVQRFNDTYVWARDIAGWLRTSPRKIVGVLRAAGVLAVAGPDIDGCRQYLFRRNEVVESGLFGTRDSHHE